MTTLTIPQKFIKEKDLVVIPRRTYEAFLLRLSKTTEGDRRLWGKASQKRFLKQYDGDDALYDAL